MVQAWWAAGLAVPALVINRVLTGKGRTRKEDSRRNRCAAESIGAGGGALHCSRTSLGATLQLSYALPPLDVGPTYT